MAAESSPLLKGVTQIMSGRAQARQLKSEAVQIEGQAKSTDIQALQSSERRREDLMASVAAITANRAQRGLSLDTPSGIAVDKEIRRQARRDEGVERLGYRNQAAALRASAAAKRRGGSQANAMGYFNAAGTLIDAAGNAAAAGAGGSKSTGGYGTSSWGGSSAPNSSFKW